MSTVITTIKDVGKQADSEFYTITIADDPKKVTTKIRDLAQEAFDFSKTGEQVEVEYESRTKRLDDGRVFHNHYFKKARPLPKNEGVAKDDEIPVIAGQARGETNPKDAWRISLAAGAKLAVASLAHTAEAVVDTPTLKRMAIDWGRFLYETPYPPSGVDLGDPEDDLDSFDRPPAHTDDDIPY